MRITHTKDQKQTVVFVTMTPEEALWTVHSLACQLASGDPNTGRVETCSAQLEKDGADPETCYFSIAAIESKARVDMRNALQDLARVSVDARLAPLNSAAQADFQNALDAARAALADRPQQ